jgi:hypothetical protein
MGALSRAVLVIGAWGRDQWLLAVGSAVALASAAEAGSRAWSGVATPAFGLGSRLDHYALAWSDFDPFPLAGLALGAVLPIIGLSGSAARVEQLQRPFAAGLVSVCGLAAVFLPPGLGVRALCREQGQPVRGPGRLRGLRSWLLPHCHSSQPGAGANRRVRAPRGCSLGGCGKRRSHRRGHDSREQGGIIASCRVGRCGAAATS